MGGERGRMKGAGLVEGGVFTYINFKQWNSPGPKPLKASTNKVTLRQNQWLHGTGSLCQSKALGLPCFSHGLSRSGDTGSQVTRAQHKTRITHLQSDRQAWHWFCSVSRQADPKMNKCNCLPGTTERNTKTAGARTALCLFAPVSPIQDTKTIAAY